MFDVKIDTAQFVEIEKRIRDDANKVLSGSALKAEVGDFAVERIKYQVRTGKPINSGDSLPGLKDSTVRQREYLAKYNATHATFEADFSNLTITGELMDSLTWDDEGDTLIRLYFDGLHSSYRGKRGQPISKQISNSTLVDYLAQKGFVVFDRSLANNKQFVSRIKTICLAYIRRGLKISSRLGAESSD